MKIQIYTLADPDTGQIKYVGKTIRNNLKSRLNEHISHSKRHKYKMACWVNSLTKQNKKPTIELVDTVGEDWAFWEQHYISLFKSYGFSLKNTTDGGDIDNTGRKASEETKALMSKNRKGNPVYMKPKGPMSEDNKKLIKEGSLKMFADKLNINSELVKKVYGLMPNSSTRKVAKILNIPSCRVYGIYYKKQYDYLLTKQEGC